MAISCQATKMTNSIKYFVFYDSMFLSNLMTFLVFLTNRATLMLFPMPWETTIGCLKQVKALKEFCRRLPRGTGKGVKTNA